MRQIVTGIDADGRSCVVTEYQLEHGDRSHGGRVDGFLSGSNPAPPRPPGRGEYVDLEVPVGQTKTLLAKWASDFSYGMHHTDTIDFDHVIEGSAVLILDDGRHVLEAGDSAIVTGVDHGWEAGPAGAAIAFVFLGTPKPD
jgi:hypothetical protein